MKIALGSYQKEIAAAAGVEDQLAATLSCTSDELNHMECLDEEQRAEIYTILQTLKSDTQAHRAVAGKLGHYVSDSAGQYVGASHGVANA